MRVISGTHGGRRLHGPDTPDTRPVTDRVKESVFSSLGAAVTGARAADLYAGAGSFGIEALSRGAESVVFVEQGRKALDALRKNLSELGFEARIERMDVGRWVDLETDLFDLVFCDPPWPLSSVGVADVLERLEPRLGSGAIVIVTRRASDAVPEPVGYTIDDDRRLGDTRIIRYMLYSRP